LRILFVAPNIPIPGHHGGSTHVTEVVRELRRNHRVLLLARRGSLGQDTRGLGGKLAPGPLRYLLPLLQFPTAMCWARQFRPEIIYDRFSSCGLGVLLAKSLKIPCLAMVLDNSATLITLKGADRLITTAPAYIAEQYRHKTLQVQWGANTDLFHPGVRGNSLRQYLGIAPDTIVIGYTGGFYPWHGLETLVESAALLHAGQHIDNLRFLLVGDGNQKNAIEQMVAAKGLSRFFVFPGRVAYERVPEYVAACDICLAPYNPANHPEMAKSGLLFDPLKIFEYLAMGKATLGPDCSNISRLFTAGEHLLVVPPGHPEILAKLCLKLATDRPLRLQLGERGQKKVAECFSWAAHVAQLNVIFAELIAKASRISRE